MAAARIAAVFLAACLSVAGAQQSSRTQLTVQVADLTGEFVRGASVALDPSPIASGTVLTTGSRGQATFDLPAGRYTFSITLLGFKKWTRQVEVQNGGAQVLTAILEVAPSPCDPCRVFVVWVPDFPLESPEPASLSLQPLHNLAPLPSHRPKKRR